MPAATSSRLVNIAQTPVGKWSASQRRMSALGQSLPIRLLSASHDVGNARKADISFSATSVVTGHEQTSPARSGGSLFLYRTGHF
jgi:hypothetical protein